MRVLITDGNERAALAAARSLVAAGHDVYAAAPERFSLAGAARGVHSLLIDVNPLAQPQRFVHVVGRAASRLGVDVALPITDGSVEAILLHRGELPERVLLPFPDLAAYRAASDKAAVLPYAKAAGLDVPETRLLDSPEADVPEPGFFPAVLKAHRSVVPLAWANGPRLKPPVAFVQHSDAFRRELSRFSPEAFPVLAQRLVRGTGEGLFLLRWDGRIVASFAHRRLREKPPQGGVSVYRESIEPPPELLAAGVRLLDALDWRGVAMIECKRDSETGRHVLMEINGRFWGSLQLAIDAGVDFPALLLACLSGATPLGPTAYRVGIRGRWFWGELDHLYLRRGSRLSALAEVLRFRPGCEHEDVWRLRDPGPFVVESLRRVGLLR